MIATGIYVVCSFIEIHVVWQHPVFRNRTTQYPTVWTGSATIPWISTRQRVVVSKGKHLQLRVVATNFEYQLWDVCTGHELRNPEWPGLWFCLKLRCPKMSCNVPLSYRPVIAEQSDAGNTASIIVFCHNVFKNFSIICNKRCYCSKISHNWVTVYRPFKNTNCLFENKLLLRKYFILSSFLYNRLQQLTYNTCKTNLCVNYLWKIYCPF